MDMHIGKMTCEDEGKDKSDASISKQCHRLPKPTETKVESWNRCFYFSKENNSLVTT